MENENILNVDPLWELIESDDLDEVEYDDYAFGVMLESANDF